jgi:Mechanosensitive ion channel
MASAAGTAARPPGCRARRSRSGRAHRVARLRGKPGRLRRRGHAARSKPPQWRLGAATRSRGSDARVGPLVTNWTLSDRLRRIELPVGIAYGTEPQRVIALLLDVARGHEQVLGQPPPQALFQGRSRQRRSICTIILAPNHLEQGFMDTQMGILLGAVVGCRVGARPEYWKERAL